MISNSDRNDELYGKRCVLDDELLKSPANLAMQDINGMQNNGETTCKMVSHLGSTNHANKLSQLGCTNHAKMLKVTTIQINNQYKNAAATTSFAFNFILSVVSLCWLMKRVKQRSQEKLFPAENHRGSIANSWIYTVDYCTYFRTLAY